MAGIPWVVHVGWLRFSSKHSQCELSLFVMSYMYVIIPELVMISWRVSGNILKNFTSRASILTLAMLRKELDSYVYC